MAERILITLDVEDKVTPRIQMASKAIISALNDMRTVQDSVVESGVRKNATYVASLDRLKKAVNDLKNGSTSFEDGLGNNARAALASSLKHSITNQRVFEGLAEEVSRSPQFAQAQTAGAKEWIRLLIEFAIQLAVEISKSDIIQKNAGKIEKRITELIRKQLEELRPSKFPGELDKLVERDRKLSERIGKLNPAIIPQEFIEDLKRRREVVREKIRTLSEELSKEEFRLEDQHPTPEMLKGPPVLDPRDFPFVGEAPGAKRVVVASLETMSDAVFGPVQSDVVENTTEKIIDLRDSTDDLGESLFDVVPIQDGFTGSAEDMADNLGLASIGAVDFLSNLNRLGKEESNTRKAIERTNKQVGLSERAFKGFGAGVKGTLGITEKGVFSLGKAVEDTSRKMGAALNSAFSDAIFNTITGRFDNLKSVGLSVADALARPFADMVVLVRRMTPPRPDPYPAMG